MAPLAAAAVLIGPAPGMASASACRGWTVLKLPSPGNDNFLSSVAVVSPRRAWAVGGYLNKQYGESTLLVRWNGTSWTTVPSPNPEGPTGNNVLAAVTATSATNVWAVGSLILHWNGTRWKQVPALSGSLADVAATSPTNAWAVGTYTTYTINGDSRQTLILHWNGTAWRRVPSPNPDPFNSDLSAVTATSRTNAWAVGCTETGCDVNDSNGSVQTLILHWNGTAWKRVPSPNPGGGVNDEQLLGLAATSSTNAWAVGHYTTNGGSTRTLILRWKGTAWRRVPSPNPDPYYSTLSGVAALSSTNAWAVGEASNGPLIAHWNGTRWKRVPSPNPGNANELLGVAALSARNIWGVGYYQDSTGFVSTFAMHRCPAAHLNGPSAAK